MQFQTTFCAILWFLVRTYGEQMCTAVAVGRQATADGSVMGLNLLDCHNCDWRLVRVEAADYPPGQTHAVYGKRDQYPRYVGDERGPVLSLNNLEHVGVRWNVSEPIGSIPQVDHTFAYLDGQYAFANEKQLFIGESTCQGRIISKSVADGGHALFHIGELIRLALMRTSTAREAILLMGGLATTYGYYPADYSLAEAGETLTLTDPQEAWVFSILPDDTGKSAVWAAQRVPDDHIAVVPNLFSIRRIYFEDHENFLASDNVVEVARRMGFFNDTDDHNFNFVQAYALPNNAKNPFDDKRRWHWYNVFAPSLKLSPYRDEYDYPFSVPVDSLIHREGMFQMARDHYEGTPFDLTKDDVLAGPWGNPWRQGLPIGYVHGGNFQRATSLRRTSYSWISQSRSWLPQAFGGLLWYSQHEPATSVYVPFYPSLSKIPDPWNTGSLYGFTAKSAWWTFATVANFADRFYSLMLEDIKSTQQRLEKEGSSGLVIVEEKALISIANDPQNTINILDAFTFSYSQYVLDEWWQLFSFLLTSYRDGYHLTRDDLRHDKLSPSFIRYPEAYLRAINFTELPDFRHPPRSEPKPLNTYTVTNLESTPHHHYFWEGIVVTGVFFLLFCLSQQFGRKDYIPLH